MRQAALTAFLAAAALAACAAVPGSGPRAGAVAAAGRPNGPVLFDVVPVDSRVVAALAAEPAPSFAARFGGPGGPPELRIAVGDTLSVFLWWPGGASGIIAPSSANPVALPPGAALPAPRIEAVPRPRFFPAARPPGGRPPPPASGAATIPDQPVTPDGSITAPYVGPVAAAGRTPEEVEDEIEERLGGGRLRPQALVIDKRSPANTVSASGEILRGGRVPLSPGGDRLLQVIAAAGGAMAPVREVFVRLSRDGVSEMIPLERLVSDPAEDIYAAPGDTLTLVRALRTFTVFGAAGRNADIPFAADRLSLAEALAKSQGLDDNLANPRGVFLFRWERDRVVRALGEPIADGAPPGLSPVAYRLDLSDADGHRLAREFPVRDKDVIFVADADAAPLRKVFEVVGTIVGPFRTALLVYRQGKC